MIAAMHFSHLPLETFQKPLITEWELDIECIHYTHGHHYYTVFDLSTTVACACVLWAPAGGREGTCFPPAMPAGAPVLNKVNWLIGSVQVKAQPVVITLCMWGFLVYVHYYITT